MRYTVLDPSLWFLEKIVYILVFILATSVCIFADINFIAKWACRLYFIYQFCIYFFLGYESKKIAFIIFSKTSKPIQLVFLDKKEQILLKEYFLKRCKKIVK